MIPLTAVPHIAGEGHSQFPSCVSFAYLASYAFSTLPNSEWISVPLQRGNNVILGTGWVSELNPRKGVLTFDNGGHDERVLILASKVYIFERRLGARQYLSDVLTEGLYLVEINLLQLLPFSRPLSAIHSANVPLSNNAGDLVQFEAVPQQQSEGENATGTSGNLYCTWFANLVWKGRRPPSVDEPNLGSTVPLGLNVSQQQPAARRGSQVMLNLHFCSSAPTILRSNELTIPQELV